MMPKVARCIDCCWCSESSRSLKDFCDLDGHDVKDADNESCERFAPLEEYAP